MGKNIRDKRTSGMQGAASSAWVAETRPNEKKMYELLAFKKSIDTILRTKYGHLTGRQFLVLDAVASRGGSATLTEVAHANQCSTQAARAFVNALQEEGYLIVFEPKDGDKRRIDIALTEEGERLVELCPTEDKGEHAMAIEEHPDALITNASMFFERWASAASASR